MQLLSTITEATGGELPAYLTLENVPASLKRVGAPFHLFGAWGVQACS